MSAAALHTALGITPEDLAANRAGRLSAAQQGRLRHARARTVRLGGGAVAVLLAVSFGLLLAGAVQGRVVLQGLGAALVACNTVLLSVVARGLHRLGADLHATDAVVVSVEGPAQHVARQFGRWGALSVRVGQRVEVPVDMAGFKAFVPQMAYRVYLAQHSGTVLTVEPLA